MRVTVVNGRAVSVQGDPDHPTTRGVLCTKVSRYAERTYHAERVLHPLRRVGPKGAGRFERVGWDEALDAIAARLDAIARRAPEAIVPYSFAGTMGLVQGEAMAGRFFNRIGASRLDRTICATAGGEALAATYGAKIGRCRIDAPGIGIPDHVSNHESRASAPELARRFPLAIHAGDAAPRGIVSGSWVRIFNDRGSYRCKAAVSSRARPGVVNGPGIWWRKLGVDGTNINELTHQHLTEIGRGPGFYGCLVEVERAAPAPA